MNRSLRSALLALSFAAAGVSVAAAADSALVDFGKLARSVNGEFVEVTLGVPLLRFAAKCAERQEPIVADLLRGLNHVKVNVIGLDDTNRSAMGERVKSIRKDLNSQGWAPIVTAQNQKDQDVVIFARLSNDETIEGLVITVVEGDRKAVLVNIAGKIKAEQLSMLAEHLQIPGLKMAAQAAAPAR